MRANHGLETTTTIHRVTRQERNSLELVCKPLATADNEAESPQGRRERNQVWGHANSKHLPQFRIEVREILLVIMRLLVPGNSHKMSALPVSH
jgi:hypothetical protein